MLLCLILRYGPQFICVKFTLKIQLFYLKIQRLCILQDPLLLLFCLLVNEVPGSSCQPTDIHSLIHPTPTWTRWTLYTSIKAIPPFIIQPSYLLLPPPSLLSLLFCPLFALPLHLLLFAAIKARVKFEPPGWHC